ncbi:hypothetical protein [Evansella halocellulosilytica]|uniref:hypothetical protein n=1 Tax=Evansella halocellulosilytica TaxID=2011013 RepID=UPI0011554CA4|nr:hypothetical protein [Evansella halocellulosilytica]
MYNIINPYSIFHVISWLNQNQGAVLATLTFIYVVATILIFRANYSSVREMKKAREEENRPYIIVFTESIGNGGINLIVKNIGKTLATNIEILSTPEIMHPKERPLNKSNLFQSIIPNMAPNFQYTGFLGMGWNLKDSSNNFPVYNVVVTYRGSHTKEYRDEYILDLNTSSKLLYMVERDINDLVNEFKDYKNKHNREMSELNNNLTELINSHSLPNRTERARNTLKKRKASIDNYF